MRKSSPPPPFFKRQSRSDFANVRYSVISLSHTDRQDTPAVPRAQGARIFTSFLHDPLQQQSCFCTDTPLLRLLGQVYPCLVCVRFLCPARRPKSASSPPLDPQRRRRLFKVSTRTRHTRNADPAIRRQRPNCPCLGSLCAW